MTNNQLTREQLRCLAARKIKSLKFAIKQSAFTNIRRGLEEELQLAEFALEWLQERGKASVEPVAWRYRFVHTPKSEEHGSPFTTGWKFCDSEEECNPSDCFERQPLYAVQQATIDIDKLQESSYKAGLTAGWNFGIEHNSAGFDKCMAAHEYTEKPNEPVSETGKPVCTCPSGDGSLRWPCPVHSGSDHEIHDGYVMVPIEPTMEMIKAAQEHHISEFYLPVSLYRAMLSAVPREVN